MAITMTKIIATVIKEIIMAITMTKIIATVTMKINIIIMMIMRIKISNFIKI